VKFKTDENLPVEIAQTLRQVGFDAETIWDEALSGTSDEVLADCARRESRVLVTLDLDFANIRACPPNQYSGIIVLRPNTQDKPTVVALLRRILPTLRERNPVGELWIVQPDRIRFRQGS
jgi:predicted nuclease of predicted toxin-antitoxin system